MSSPQVDRTEQVLLALSEALKAEVTAVHQYLLHARLCHNWGYNRLAEHNRKESTEELGHAERLIDRILSLNGTPNMKDVSPIPPCANVKEQFESQLGFEKEAIARLNEAVQIAREGGDNVSRRIFDEILADEDHHAGYLDSQLHIIGEIGLEAYLAQQIH
jgi:bacterioferritin